MCGNTSALKELSSAATVAVNLRQWCSAIFRYAASTLRADTDPAAALKGAIHRPRTEHSKPLSRDDIATFDKALQSYGGYHTTIIALRLMLLTFVRPPADDAQPSKGVPQEELERIALRILLEHGRPLQRQALFDRVKATGITIGGRDERANFGTKISRSAKFVNLSKLGYWPKDNPCDSAGYRP